MKRIIYFPSISGKAQYKDVYRRTIEILQRSRIFKVKGPFTRCGSGCDNGAIINWITLYLMELFIGTLVAAAAATVLQVNRFQPHSVCLLQRQNILHDIVCYFATAAAAQNGVGIQLIAVPWRSHTV